MNIQKLTKFSQINLRKYILPVIPLIFLSAPVPQVLAQTTDITKTFQYKGELEIGFTNKFIILWNDKGSGASKDAAIWRPVPQPGYFSLGDVIVPSYEDINGKRIVFTVKD